MFTFQGGDLGHNEVEVVEAYLQTAGIPVMTLKKVLTDLWAVYNSHDSVHMNTWLQETQQEFDLNILTDAVEIIFGDGEDAVESQDDDQMQVDQEKTPLTLTSFDKHPRPGSPDPYKSQKKSGEKPFADGESDLFLKHWSARLQEYRSRLPKKAADKRKEEITSSEPDERHLARLAWVLDKLNARRVCVAILLTSDHTFYVYANSIDGNLAADVNRLIQATRDQPTYAKLKADVIQAALSELRGQKGSIDRCTAKARRRLNKALRFLSRFNNPTFHIHQPRTANKHAEMRAADAAHTSGSIGISKLCCGKCTMALTALTQVKGISFGVLGTHLKTYSSEAGWPIPIFLREEKAMEAFLGKAAYKIYKLHSSACDQLIQEEELTMKTLKAFKETDIVSSQESQASLSFSSQQSQDTMDVDLALPGSQGEGEDEDEDDYDEEDDVESQDLFTQERIVF
jgi:hypothetical protein